MKHTQKSIARETKQDFVQKSIFIDFKTFKQKKKKHKITNLDPFKKMLFTLQQNKTKKN